jgi:phenylpyruvate tautomerase PptA (4-oxalocrotonate tautomerase family)
MPLVRVDLRKGKSAAHKKAIADGVYRALRETFTVPEEDRFIVTTEHDDDGFIYSANYLDIARSGDLVFVQITVTNSRGVEQKKALFARIVALLAEKARAAARGRLHQSPRIGQGELVVRQRHRAIRCRELNSHRSRNG